MITKQLLSYIQNERQDGASDAQIRQNLQEVGWKDADIDEGFANVDGEAGGSQPQQPTNEQTTETNQMTESQPSGTQEAARHAPDESLGQPIGQQATGSGSGEVRFDTDRTPAEADDKTVDYKKIRQNAFQKAHQGDSNHQEPIQNTRSVDDSGVQSNSVNNKSTGEADAYREPIDPDDTSGPSAVSKPGGSKSLQKQVDEGSKQPDSSAESSDADQTGMKDIEMGGSQLQSQMTDEAERYSKQEQARREARDKGKQQKQDLGAAAGAMAGGRFAGKDMQQAKQAQTSDSSSGGSRSILTAVLVVVLLVVLGAGGVFAYVTWFGGSLPGFLPFSIDGGSDTEEISAATVMQSLYEQDSFRFRLRVDNRPTDSQGTETATSSNTSAVPATPTVTILQGAINASSSAEPSYVSFAHRNSSTGQSLISGIQASLAEVNAYRSMDLRQVRSVESRLASPDFFGIGAMQTEEAIAGVSTNRYVLNFEPMQLIEMYRFLHTTIFDERLSSSLEAQLEQNIGDITITSGQIWIDPVSSLPYQISLAGVSSDGTSRSVTIQLREYGNEIDAPAGLQERRFSQVLADFYSAVGSTASSEAGGQASDTATPESLTTRQADQLRVNDIQQLGVLLSLYAQENGQYPASLQALSQSGLASSGVPTDPTSGYSYSYSVSGSGDSYHLGATLRQIDPSSMYADANFDSAGGGWANGFNGANASACSGQASGSCYDVTESLSQ